MCGIAGSLDLRPAVVDSEGFVARMTDVLAHRGPDDAGLLVDPPAVLGHRRHSILDLSPAGHQPMGTQDGRLWITYNGEIYNYIELRSELRALGRRFLSASDTEVVLNAYAEWGPDALRRLNGDFAFVIWDRVRRELFCARDRFGAKPLYYTVAGGRFSFASEIKALLLDPTVPRRPNEPRVLDFLARELADHTDETMFEAVHQLPPGSYAFVSSKRGVAPPVRWYRPRPAELGRRPTPGTVRELLDDAVRLRLRSDIPVGVALSGGLDSSSVMAVASAVRRAEGAPPLLCLRARCGDPRRDESAYSEALLRRTGSPSEDVYPSEQGVVDDLDTVLWHMDEPFHSPSVYGHWKVMGLARANGLGVVLEGQVGDDVFAGYHSFYPAFFCDNVRSGRLGRAASEIAARSRYLGVPARASIVQLLKHTLPRRLRARRVPGWISREVDVLRPPLPGRSVTDVQLHSLTVTPTPAYLHHDDRNSLSFAVESRSPYLDHRLVEHGLALAPEALLHDGYSKWALREAVRDLLPPAIVERRQKQGFTVDQAAWLQGGLGSALEETFGSRRLADRPYFVQAELLAALRAARAGTGGSQGLWRAFLVERWLRLFVDGASTVAPPRAALAPRAFVDARDHVVRFSVPAEAVLV